MSNHKVCDYFYYLTGLVLQDLVLKRSWDKMVQLVVRQVLVQCQNNKGTRALTKGRRTGSTGDVLARGRHEGDQ